MKNNHYYLAFLALTLFLTSCSKDDGTKLVDETTKLISDLLVNPELLIGYWNIENNANASKGSSKSTSACEVSMILFNQDKTFKIKNGDTEVNGSFEVTGEDTINLLQQSTSIGSIIDIVILNEKITFSLNLTDVCSQDVKGVKYFAVNDFIWKSLNELYYWQKDVPDLDDSKNDNSGDYANYLKKKPDPEEFFNSLKFSEDRFSLIDSDYVSLANQLAGISASNGVEFILNRFSSSDNVFGVVTFIQKESDASLKNIKRGDIFTGVNGTDLTVSNYRALLFGDNLSYTLNMSDYSSSTITPNALEVALTKVENFQDNSIHISKTISAGGAKIGYLMYNGFVGSFDENLNTVFAGFKSDNITDLVIDLRYNGGGLISSCVYLAGMVSGQFTGEIFAQNIYNSKLMNYYETRNNTDWMKFLFVSEMSDGTALNSLNLNRVYILTSGRSASASELLINGLAPHIEVVQIGDTTVGKNVGSFTVYDYIDNKSTKNPDHTYALQPIIFKVANSADFSDYSDGLTPDAGLLLKEDIANLGVLGEVTEPLLALAIGQINGTSARSAIRTTEFPIDNAIEDPKMLSRQNLVSEKQLP
jgi:C-terminal processing protease CtpA/Prc